MMITSKAFKAPNSEYPRTWTGSIRQMASATRTTNPQAKGKTLFALQLNTAISKTVTKIGKNANKASKVKSPFFVCSLVLSFLRRQNLLL